MQQLKHCNRIIDCKEAIVWGAQELWDAFKMAVLKAERVLLYEIGFDLNVRRSTKLTASFLPNPANFC